MSPKIQRNMQKFLRDGPRWRSDWETEIIARTPDGTHHLKGGLGCMGVGQMWMKTDANDRKRKDYQAAPIVDYDWREEDRFRAALWNSSKASGTP